MCLVASGVGRNGPLQPLARQRKIGVAGEFAGQEFGRIDDHLRGAVLNRRQHLARAGDDDVAPEHEIGAPRGDADGVDVLRLFGELRRPENARFSLVKFLADAAPLRLRRCRDASG